MSGDRAYELILETLQQMQEEGGAARPLRPAKEAADAVYDALTGGMWLLQQHEPGTHRYLSTSCYHDKHERCAEAWKEDGSPKTPAQCKFCESRCVCPCHTPPEREAAGPFR